MTSRNPSPEGPPLGLAPILIVPDARAASDFYALHGSDTDYSAGATILGELYGRLKDPFGHEWTIAQMLEAFKNSEIEEAAIAVFESNNPRP